MCVHPAAPPLQTLCDRTADRAGVRWQVLRDDLTGPHPELRGNKWRKLKWNLRRARAAGHTTLVAFGGPHSNLLRAVAAAGHFYGFRTVGVVRGNEPRPLNASLRWAAAAGMTLHPVSRADYRRKDAPTLLATLSNRYGRFYPLPEGGSNAWAVAGSRELMDHVPPAANWVIVPCGTGGTLAGLVAGLRPGQRALGVAVLKGAGFLHEAVRAHLAGYAATCQTNFSPVTTHRWTLALDHHYGGYARTTPALLAFARNFTATHGIAVEPVYSAKMFCATAALLQAGHFSRGDTLVNIHTGGIFPASP